MGMGNTPEWFVDVNGSKRGPYSGHQIEELFRNGSVHPDTLLYHSQGKAAPTTVRQLLDLSSSSLPARPAVDLNKPMLPPSMTEDHADPTLSLFDALQSTKHKKTHMPDPSSDRMRNTAEGSRFTETQIWFAGAMVMIVGILIWGTTRLINYSSELASAKPESASAEFKTTPAQAPSTVPQSIPASQQPHKNLSDFVQKPAPKTVQAPAPTFNRFNDRDRNRQRELELERERQKQRDLELEREREMEYERERDHERRDLRKKEVDPFDRDPGTLQQAPAPAPPPPSDPDAALID